MNQGFPRPTGMLADAGGAGDGEGAVPGERADVLAPVVVEPVAGVGDDLQVTRSVAGGAEVALDQRHRVVDVVGSEDIWSMPQQVGGVVVTPEVGQAPAGQRDHDLEVPGNAEVALDQGWRCCRSSGAGNCDGTMPGERADVLARVVVEAVAGVGDDLQVARSVAGGAEAALDQRRRVVVAGRPEQARPMPRQVGGVVVTPEVGQAARQPRRDDVEVAFGPEASLDERRTLQPGGAGDGEGAVPSERADVLAPVMVEPVASASNEFQVAGAVAGGAEVALDERYRVVVVVGPEDVWSVPGQVGGIVVAPEMGQPNRLKRSDELEVAPGAEATLQREAATWLGLGFALAQVEEEWVDRHRHRRDVVEREQRLGREVDIALVGDAIGKVGQIWRVVAGEHPVKV